MSDDESAGRAQALAEVIASLMALALSTPDYACPACTRLREMDRLLGSEFAREPRD